MKIKPDFDIDKWCVYNENKFELEIKEEAPKEIKEKFYKWKHAYDLPWEREIEEFKKMLESGEINER